MQFPAFIRPDLPVVSLHLLFAHSCLHAYIVSRTVLAVEIVQVRSATSSPRVSVVSAGPRLVHKTSEATIPTTPSFKQHRFSTDSTDYKFVPKAKLSLTEDMGNTNRRLSRGGLNADGSTNGLADAQIGLAESLKLSQYQTSLLQSTWLRLKMQNTVFVQVFKLLCFKSPVCREMFQKMSIVEGFRSHQCCDMNNHAKVRSYLEQNEVIS
ncbi:hypothetical protein WR25_04855 [Diploscapter pachys]|uniref:Uncharacterized protein n=1 Tax=Diploscapter pachys TaxID=2018661 RepID=A0A2A2LX76_9BILA|nr:hypothetical protein WR25_04855 [Diploscapter pachys]